ncbi:MAG: HAD-IC family P-type ATPase [Candidatus Bathyarchaeia archaeon]
MSNASETAKAASKEFDEFIKEIGTDPEKGLTTAEVKLRLEKFGENTLEGKEEETFWAALKEEAREPMILLLIGVGVLYSIWGNILDAATIFTVIAVLVLSEVYNEWKAEQGIESLKELTTPRPLVLRDGKVGEVESAELVPGDVLPLSVGERIPADLRLYRSYGLQLDESSLTGESMPVSKTADIVMPEGTQITDLSNMALAGTLIVQGEGVAIVSTTGRNTELGHIATLTEEAEEEETPLQVAMAQLSKTLVWVALFFSISIPVLEYLRNGALQTPQTLILTGLSLSFAVIPEELPIIITMVLAVGTYSLSRRGALVKHLRASETLGSVTIIATDKTGTITESVMKLGHIYSQDELIEPKGDASERGILEMGVLATRGQTTLVSERFRGFNPMGAAIVDSATSSGVSMEELAKRSLVNEFSFDTRTKTASYVYREGDKLRVYMSGAPEAVLSKSSKILRGGRSVSLSNPVRGQVNEAIEKIAQMGERALAVVYKDLSDEEVDTPPESGMIFVGLLSFIDPPRKEVPEVIKMCKEAGIRVVMLTGDHPETAKAVAAKVGIDSASVLTGPEISLMDDAKLGEALKTTSVFARITPEHKLRIVKLFKENGQVVAVTGDGVNDAPALKEAAIGIAMGVRGTDAAKEAADIVLTDDNFVSIGSAVREGRKIFDNLRKGVKYYLAVKVALVLIFILPIILNVPLPFAPIQIILLEMFMDLAASSGFVAEGFESDLMTRPPRDPSAKFLDRGTLTGIFASAISLFVAVSFCYLTAYYRSGDLVYAQTVAFSTWIISHIFLAFVRRSEKEPLLKRGLFSNRVMVLWAIAAIGLLVVVIYVPFLQGLVRVTALGWVDWATVVAASFVATIWIEAAKYIRPK